MFRGQNRSSLTQEVLEQARELKAQISVLEAQEKELDEQRELVEENMNHLNHDPDTSAYPSVYVFNLHHLLFFCFHFALKLHGKTSYSALLSCKIILKCLNLLRNRCVSRKSF